MLEAEGFSVELAASGEEALGALQWRQPELAILEVRLGDLSGYEICRAVRHRFGTRPVVVLVSAAPTDPAELSAARMWGADGYLEKPFTSIQLRARVQQLLDHAGPEGG